MLAGFELPLADLPVLTAPWNVSFFFFSSFALGCCCFFEGRENNLFLFILCVFAQRYCIDASRVRTRPGVGVGEESRGGVGWGTSHAHWQTINNNNNNEKSNKKNPTSCALWETDLPQHHQRQTSIHTRQLGSAKTSSFRVSFILFQSPHKTTHSYSWSDQQTQSQPPQSTCTVKNFLFFCFLRDKNDPRRLCPPCPASFFFPLLLLYSKRRRTLDLAGEGLLCVYTWRRGIGEGVRGRGGGGRAHHGAQHSIEAFLFGFSFPVQPSVSLILTFLSLLSEPASRSECILTVQCCELVFCYYFLIHWIWIWHGHHYGYFLKEFLVKRKLPKKKYLYLFVSIRATTKTVFLTFFSILYFVFLTRIKRCCGFVTLLLFLLFVFFGYGQLCCVTLSSRASFHVCKWSLFFLLLLFQWKKNACATFLEGKQSVS